MGANASTSTLKCSKICSKYAFVKITAKMLKYAFWHILRHRHNPLRSRSCALCLASLFLVVSRFEFTGSVGGYMLQSPEFWIVEIVVII